MSIEDPFDQDDWATYAKMTGEVGQQVQIVGDDLLVTNPTVSYISPVYHWIYQRRRDHVYELDRYLFEYCRGLPRRSVRRPAMLFS